MSRKTQLLRYIKRHRRLSAWILLGLILLLIPSLLSVRTFVIHHGDARMYFSTPYTQVQLEQEFTIDLRVNTNGHVINALQSKVTFDPKRLEVVGITTDKSFCTLFTENYFNPTAGSVSIACGTPHPGFTGDSLIVSMHLRAKSVGDATIKVDPSTASVLADDGKATELIGTVSDYPLSIKQASY